MNPFTFTTVMRSKPSPVLPGTIGLVLWRTEQPHGRRQKPARLPRQTPAVSCLRNASSLFAGMAYIPPAQPGGRRCAVTIALPMITGITIPARWPPCSPPLKFPGKHVLLVGVRLSGCVCKNCRFLRIAAAGKPVAFYNRARHTRTLLAWYPYSCYKNLPGNRSNSINIP